MTNSIWLTLVAIVLFSSTPGLAFDYGDLETLVRTKDVRSIEQLLPLLPESYRANYTFVYASRGINGANVFPEWPRVILMGSSSDKDTLVLAFGKRPSEGSVFNGPDLLETMDFNPAEERFIFRALDFSSGENPVAKPVPANPQQCLACHRRDPRPNWDAYNFWPGVYGSVHRDFCSVATAGTPEIAGYQAFLAGNRHRGRYQFLAAEKPANKTCTLNTEIAVTNAVSESPAENVGDALFLRNFARLRRMTEASPNYPKLKYWIEALSRVTSYPQACQDAESNPESYFPARFAARHRFLAYPDLVADVLTKSRAEFKARVARFELYNRPSQSPGRAPVNFNDPQDTNNGSSGVDQDEHLRAVAIIRMIAERSGLPFSDWSMAFTDGEHDFMKAGEEPLPAFMWYRKASPELEEFSCAELREKSIAAFASR